MQIKKLSILFLIQKSKINKQGKCPLRCRITYKDERYEFATGQFVYAHYWQSKTQLAKPSTKENEIVNSQLSLIKNQLHQAFLYLQLKGESFDVKDIYKVSKGETVKKEMKVLQVFREHNSKIKELVGKNLELVTYKKYEESYNHVKSFIDSHYKDSDMKLSDLKTNFLMNFEHFLLTEKSGLKGSGLAVSTINKAVQRFRRVIKYAISEGYIERDPFILHKSKTEFKELIFLSVEELARLESVLLKSPRIQNIKSLFVFCCYTGLPFKEMSRLKKKDIVCGFDGNLWVNVSRSKTKKQYSIPLLPQAKAIVEIFNDEHSEYVFPKISNQKFNAYLKEIAAIVGIEKHLTHHVARKTFASTVLLYNGVPLEIVSELLGHARIGTTQGAYAKVVQPLISNAVKKIMSKNTNNV